VAGRVARLVKVDNTGLDISADVSLQGTAAGGYGGKMSRTDE
jgi:hypothetical protein